MEPGNEEKVRIGISSCLLGNEVRFDGSHKHDRYITGTLGKFFDFVPVCPEVECGMTIPREALRLIGDPEAPRLVTSRSRVDHTERMTSWAHKRIEELESEKLCGFIFKSKSPSSGMERVKVYDKNNVPRFVAWVSLPGNSWAGSLCFQLRRKAACMILPCVKILSNPYLFINAGGQPCLKEVLKTW